MDNSYNVIRRFTPPTCTLEIWGKSSPLSRWKNKKIVKDIQFKLSFDDPQNIDAEPITIEGDRNKLERLYTTVLDYMGKFLEQSFNAKSLSSVTSNDNLNNSDRPYLTTQGLVNHQLNLGSLASDNASIIALSATQLFDLVSALEEYKAEMAAIAQLEAEQSKKSRPWIPLGASVAGILLAVGVVTGIRTQRSQEVVTTQEPINPVTPQAEVVPPEAPEVAEKPALEIEENDPLSSTEMLPPPPAVDTPKPPPNIPDPAKYPPSGNLSIPPVSELPKQDEVTLNPTESTTEAQPPLDDSQVESTIDVPSETAESTSSENAELEIASESDTQVSIASPTENVENSEIAISDNNIEIDTDIVGQGDRITAFNEERSSEATQNNPEENFALSDRLALDNNTAKPSTDEATIAEDEATSKISQLPQLQEIESYFQQKWQIPDELKQTLEYRLILGSDGSIQRIIPIGKAAEIYVDRTNIPLMGEPFVSPLQNRDNATIRLLLSPDGEVKTFLE